MNKRLESWVEPQDVVERNTFTFDRSVFLGKGGFGAVYKGTWGKENSVKIEVAVKRVVLHQIKENGQHEENNLRSLNHPNVVKLFDALNDDDFRNFILELCDASLDQVFLHPNDPKKYQGPALPHYFVVLFQLATGLEYIHSQNLVHRDVKPENVLISVDSTSKTVTLKWADFGLSRPVNERGTYTMSNLAGTENWMAPELFEQSQRLANVDTKQFMQRGTVKSDIFALGLVFAYYLRDGTHPYGLTNDEIRINFKRKSPTDVIKFENEYWYLNNIILKMLEIEIKRIESSEVLQQLTKVTTQDGSNAICVICKNYQENNFTDIRHLIDRGFNVNYKNNKGLNALLYLCRDYKNGNLIDIVRLLVEKGIDVNCTDFEGWNALLYLCRDYKNKNLIDIVRLLVEKGIDVNCTDFEGWNALHLLRCHYQNENLNDIVQLLVEKL